ncbi:MAG TPA: hypothetical protein VF315_02610, partial [Steroidobacteraceae bacterium]
MHRKALISWLLLLPGVCGTADADAPPSLVPPSDAAPHAPAVDSTAARELAIARARAALRAAGMDPAAMTLTSVRPVIWPDSSLGCRRPGIQYLPVQSPGYRVEFHDALGAYVAHVGGKRAILCPTSSGPGAPLQRPLAPLRDVDVMTARAKQMLADLLHVPAAQIRVVSLDPQVWPDTSLG